MFKIILRKLIANPVIKKLFSQIAVILYKVVEYGKIVEKEKRKLELIAKIKKIGNNSYLWGDIHAIICPENLEIGKNVHINNNCYINAIGGVFIGDNTHISRNLLLYSVNHNYEGECLPYDEDYIKKPVIIGNNVWIGMNVCICPGSVIGDGVIIGMGTVVNGNVPPLSIIGSQKWRQIGERNKERYEQLVNAQLFGGANGFLLNEEYDKQLKRIGDKKFGSRCFLEVINFNNNTAIKKTFLYSKNGRIAFDNEKLAYKLLSKYAWFPKVYEVGENYLVYEYFSNDLRLDISINKYNRRKKYKILNEIIQVLFDLFKENISHRDFNIRNMFYSDEFMIKVIDYETIEKIDFQNTDFFNTYDIIGQGLESPFGTNNMCIFNTLEISVSKSFSINTMLEFKNTVEMYMKEKLYDISSTFYTRRYQDKDRHILRKHYIYNTFDLPYLKVNAKIGQRNISKRLEQFGITKDIINGKRILDIGSNIGGLLLEIQKMNPVTAVGLEYDKDKVDISNLIAKMHGIKNVTFYEMDVESDYFNIDFNEKYDVVFCLAVIGHLKKADIFLRKIAEICNCCLYLEGNANMDIYEIQELLKNVGFSTIKYIGLSTDEKDRYNNNRPVFICKI